MTEDSLKYLSLVLWAHGFCIWMTEIALGRTVLIQFLILSRVSRKLSFPWNFVLNPSLNYCSRNQKLNPSVFRITSYFGLSLHALISSSYWFLDLFFASNGRCVDHLLLSPSMNPSLDYCSRNPKLNPSVFRITFYFNLSLHALLSSSSWFLDLFFASHGRWVDHLLLSHSTFLLYCHIYGSFFFSFFFLSAVSRFTFQSPFFFPLFWLWYLNGEV